MADETRKATIEARKFEAALKAVQFEADELAEGAAEQLSERFDFGFLEIERKARETFKSINKMTPEEMELSVALDERSIDKIQNEIGDINSKIKSYNRTLDLIGRQETAITETYDQKIDSLNKQRDALESIKSINSFLISQQQKQLGIANALTQGDISAAAAAAQEMRAESAQESLNRMGSGLETAANNLEVQKQRELSSITAVVNGQKLTRKQIETEIVTLSDKIYNIEVIQLEPLQRQADIKRQLLSDLAFQIDREQKSLQINGMTRQEWNFIQQYVEASNKVSNSLKINIDAIATSSTTASGAWASILASMQSASTLSFNTPGTGSTATGAGGSTVTGTKVVDGRTVVTSTSGTGTPFGQAGSTGSTVTVKSGNTLSGIAAKAGVSLASVIKANPQISNPNLIKPGQVIKIPGKMYGGMVKPMSMGGMVPKYLANGGRIGSDSVPTMLTPGEFVMNKGATAEFGPMLSMLNESKYPSMIGDRSSAQVPVNNVSTSVSDNSTAVYNYNLGFSINGSNANANDIARVVMREIKNVDSQRIRGQRV
jgi:LysM repeat protein